MFSQLYFKFGVLNVVLQTDPVKITICKDWLLLPETFALK